MIIIAFSIDLIFFGSLLLGSFFLESSPESLARSESSSFNHGMQVAIAIMVIINAAGICSFLFK